MTHSKRVRFEQPIRCQLLGIDGTWRRDCTMIEVSDEEATLNVHGSIERLGLSEFFLSMSQSGLAYRRCELAWVNGEQMGVTFVSHGRGKRRKSSE